MGRPLLEIEKLNRRFGGLHAVCDLSFSVPEGAIKALIGPNGAGKTTVFNLIAGSLEPDGGCVKFRGRPITGARPYRIAGLGIARTFQTTRLFPRMTVLENVMVGRHPRTRAGFLASLFNTPFAWREEKEIRESARNLLAKLDLGEYAGERAGNLSFGRQRLVEFARALATEPKLLLLDEPAAGLNIYETEELARLIERIRGWGITVLLVEHDMSLVMDISDEVIVLNQGRRIAEGKPREIQKNPEVIRVYLGDDDA